MKRGSLSIASLTMASALAHAQNLEAPLRFEVASVRAASPTADPAQGGFCRGGPGGSPPGRMECVSAPLRMLVFFAYGVRRDQVIGPDWIDSAAYDITANVPQGINRDQMKLMLRSLLEERFHLAVRRETRQLPIYSLEVGKGGTRMKKSLDAPVVPQSSSSSTGNQSSASSAPEMTFDKNGLPDFPEHGPGGMAFRSKDGHTRVKARKQTLAELVRVLSSLSLGRPFVDNTGLTGKYDFDLDFVTDAPVSVSGVNSQTVGELPDLPGLVTALQEQLGLKLRSTKGPVEALIIDKVDPAPTENY